MGGKSLRIECDFCGKVLRRYGEVFKCRYCGGVFCAEHRLPPNHQCLGIDRWVEEGTRPYETLLSPIEQPAAYETTRSPPPDRGISPWTLLLAIALIFSLLFNAYFYTVVGNLQKRYSDLQTKYEELYKEYSEIKQVYDELVKVPANYYSSNHFADYSGTYSELCSFLASLGPVHSYEENVFDCSEFASYLEWALEDAGFDAYIVVGPDPSGKSSQALHAWVLVKTSDGREVMVEPTAFSAKNYPIELLYYRYYGIAPGVVNELKYGESAHNYWRYNQCFKNVYQAVNAFRSVDEWDWWTVLPPP